MRRLTILLALLLIAPLDLIFGVLIIPAMIIADDGEFPISSRIIKALESQ